MKIEINQIWRHKKRKQLLRVEKIIDSYVYLREVERTNQSPPEGTLYGMSKTALEILWELYNEDVSRSQ